MLIRSFAIALVLLSLAVPAMAETVRVALLPVSVHAAGEGSEYLQTGLAEMIAARVDQYEGVTVVRPAVKGVEPSERETALAAARGVDADYVLFGSFTRFGNGASLDLRCLPTDPAATLEHRRLFIQSGELAEIIPKLDTLAQRVVRYTVAAGKSPVKRGSSDGTAPAGPSAADYQALVKRVEELERALIPPVAEKPAEDDVLVR